MLSVSIDVGGTFTDAVAVDDETGMVCVLKLASTPQTPEKGFVRSLGSLLEKSAHPPTEVSALVHVSTIGGNLLLGQVGISRPSCGLVTTKGFRDVIEIGRQNRPDLYDIGFRKPRPLVDRKARFEVDERTDSDGKIVKRVRADELEAIAQRIISLGIESVAVVFLNSFANRANERRAAAYIRRLTRLPVHISSEVDPEYREYERTSTTVVSALLSPVFSSYLAAAEDGARASGVRAQLQVLSSSGGLVDSQEARLRPILAIESGPAAGVAGAAQLARALGIRKAISFDMGGTTAKAGSIIEFRPLLVPEFEVGGRIIGGRTMKGSGYPVRTASIDLAEVSGGGGTMISVDAAGSLRVGPMSAGAEPGPACYGKGGKEPTITDANLVLGRIGTELLGGELRLDARAAKASFEKIAKRTRIDPLQLAGAAIGVVNLQMAKAIQIVSLERGLDPREFTLIAFGGAGPMHAAELAEEVGIGSVVIPPMPGLFSALGMVLSESRYDEMKGVVVELDRMSADRVEREFESLEGNLRSRLSERGVEAKRGITRRGMDLRYRGQGYEIQVDVPRGLSRKDVIRRFERKHRAIYGFLHEGKSVEVTALRTALLIPGRKVELRAVQIHGEGEPLKGRRRVWLDGRWVGTPVYRRESLRPQTIDGPAVLESYDSTVVIPQGWEGRVDDLGCLRMERRGS